MSQVVSSGSSNISIKNNYQDRNYGSTISKRNVTATDYNSKAKENEVEEYVFEEENIEQITPNGQKTGIKMAKEKIDTIANDNDKKILGVTKRNLNWLRNFCGGKNRTVQEEEQSLQFLLDNLENTVEDLEEDKSTLEEKYRKTIYDDGNTRYPDLWTDGYSYLNPIEFEKSDVALDHFLIENGYNPSYGSEERSAGVEAFHKYVKDVYTPAFEKYFTKEMGMTFEEYREKIIGFEQDILTLETSRYALVQQYKLLPYQEINQSEEYKKYVLEKKNNKDVITVDGQAAAYGKLVLYCNGEKINENMYGQINPISLGKAFDSGQIDFNQHNYGTYNTDLHRIIDGVSYAFLSEDERLLYSYLFDTKGKEEADKYIEAMQDTINQRKGQKEAEDFLNSIRDENGNFTGEWYECVANFFKSSAKGAVDGIENFGEGIGNVFAIEGMISANQYAQMYILNEIGDNGYGVGYNLGVSFGNMVPSMVASTVISIIATPAVGSTIGYSLMGLSAGGSAKNQSLIDGNDVTSSILYGTIIGLSETGLGKLLGNIPGLNEDAAFSLKGILSEGLEEYLQTYVEAGANAVINGETVDLTELSGEALASFAYGCAMAFLMNGGNMAFEATIGSKIVKINDINDLTNLNNQVDNELNIGGEITTELPKVENVIAEAEITAELPKVENVIAEAEITTELPKVENVIAEAEITTELPKVENVIAEEKHDLITEKDNLTQRLTDEISKLGYTVEEFVKKCGEVKDVDASATETVKSSAKAINDAAHLSEPSITKDMMELETNDVKLVGLEHKFKSLESLERKISLIMKKDGVDVDTASSWINDSLRYTLQINSESYVSQMLSSLNDLMIKGYSIDTIKNFWHADAIYQGVNVTLTSPDGVSIELQFHTPESYDVKENKNHSFYEIARSSPELKSIADHIMQINQELYVKPISTLAQMPKTGDSVGIRKLLDIYHLKHLNGSNASKTIFGTNIADEGPYSQQLKDAEGKQKFPGTNLPNDSVITDIDSIIKIGNGDISVGLKNIEAKFGKSSIELATARGTVIQYFIKNTSLNSNQNIHGYETIAGRIRQIYLLLGLDARDLTLLKQPNESSDACCERIFKSDFDYWESLRPSDKKAMENFTASAFSKYNGIMRFSSFDKNTSDFNELIDTFDIYTEGIKTLSSQLDSLPGLSEDTIIYRGLYDLDWIANEALKGLSINEMNDIINSWAGGTYSIGDSSFESSTPVLGEGFTGATGIVEVCFCPKGTKGSYIGRNSSCGWEVEYLMQAGNGNKKVILGSEILDGQLFVYTQIID